MSLSSLRSYRWFAYLDDGLMMIGGFEGCRGRVMPLVLKVSGISQLLTLVSQNG